MSGPMVTIVTRYTGGLSQLPLVKISQEKIDYRIDYRIVYKIVYRIVYRIVNRIVDRIIYRIVYRIVYRILIIERTLDLINKLRQ